NHSLAPALMRTSSRARPAAGSACTAWCSAARAVALSAGATASSQSAMTMSAPLARALGRRSGRVAGTNRKEQALRAREAVTGKPGSGVFGDLDQVAVRVAHVDGSDGPARTGALHRAAFDGHA